MEPPAKEHNMSRTFREDKIMMEAFQTQKTKEMLIERIMDQVYANPQILLDEGLWDTIKNVGSAAVKGYAGGGGLASAAKGALGSEAGQNLMQQGLAKASDWAQNLGGAQPATADATQAAQGVGAGGETAAASTPTPQTSEEAGGVWAQIKNLLAQLDIPGLQKILATLQSLIGNVA